MKPTHATLGFQAVLQKPTIYGWNFSEKSAKYLTWRRYENIQRSYPFQMIAISVSLGY